MLDDKRRKQIWHAAVSGKPEKGYTPDEKQLYDTLVEQISTGKHVPDHPHEFPEFTPEEIAKIKAAQSAS